MTRPDADDTNVMFPRDVVMLPGIFGSTYGMALLEEGVVHRNARVAHGKSPRLHVCVFMDHDLGRVHFCDDPGCPDAQCPECGFFPATGSNADCETCAALTDESTRRLVSSAVYWGYEHHDLFQPGWFERLWLDLIGEGIPPRMNDVRWGWIRQAAVVGMRRRRTSLARCARRERDNHLLGKTTR